MSTDKNEWINERAWAYAATDMGIAEANRQAVTDYYDMIGVSERDG